MSTVVSTRCGDTAVLRPGGWQTPTSQAAHVMLGACGSREGLCVSWPMWTQRCGGHHTCGPCRGLSSVEGLAEVRRVVSAVPWPELAIDSH
jgi:hypothetical protein